MSLKNLRSVVFLPSTVAIGLSSLDSSTSDKKYPLNIGSILSRLSVDIGVPISAVYSKDASPGTSTGKIPFCCRLNIETSLSLNVNRPGVFCLPFDLSANSPKYPMPNKSLFVLLREPSLANNLLSMLEYFENESVSK